MARLGDFYQTGDWNQEKHAPVIEAPDSVQAGQAFEFTVSVGKEIAHPNTTEHHIRWIRVFFQPEGEKFTIDLGAFDFNAHAESAKGANEGVALTEPLVTGKASLKKSGTLFATSYCNIHGLWENQKEIKVS